MRNLDRRRVVRLALGAAAASVAFPVAAHHGWGWAEERQSELTGTIKSVSMAPPHPSMYVNTADGEWWVELGNPGLTERAGFTATSAKPGDQIVVLGNRHQDKTKKHMKAVRITVAGKQFDIYPERIRAN